ncbi:membrane metalloprotease [Flavobacterium faecale]|uniref:membrane metalloprotease n=1 Tax=Flavobacterium faecale TaxID=1355330 RepID=UPI003AAAB9A6
MKKEIALVLIFFSLLFSCSQDDSSGETVNGNLVSNNKKSTGSSSRDLLSSDQFKSMVLEVVYIQGSEPSTTAISNLVAFLNERSNKPEGIRVVKRAISSPQKTSFTNQDIIAIEDANRTLYNSDSEIAVWAFFADGESANNTSDGVVLGTAYRNTSFAIYQKTIQRLSGGPFQPSRSLLETTVIEHEFGHLFGLTNLGAPLQSNHEDSEHAKHCNVESCLMYWAAETGGGIGSMLSGGSVPKLDSQCLADLKANGGK